MIPSPAQILIALLLVIAAAAGGFYHGVEYQDGKQAQLDRARLDLEARATADFWEGQRKTVAAIGRQLADERQARSTDARNFRDKLNSLRNVSHETLAECVPVEQPAGSVPDPPARPVRARLGIDGMRDWNAALGLAVDQADRAAWIDGANAAPGPVEIIDALQNVADNAELLGACRAREAGWHKFARDNNLTP